VGRIQHSHRQVHRDDLSRLEVDSKEPVLVALADDEIAPIRGGNDAVDVNPLSTGRIHVVHRCALKLQEFLKLILSRPGGLNTIKHRVDGVRDIRTAIWCESSVVQKGLSCAKTIIQLRNEPTGFGVVDEDQARLAAYYHQAVVGEKH